MRYPDDTIGLLACAVRRRLLRQTGGRRLPPRARQALAGRPLGEPATVRAFVAGQLDAMPFALTHAPDCLVEYLVARAQVLLRQYGVTR